MPTMLPAPKLYYFDFPGKAGGLRLAAAHGGLEIEDHRFKDRDELTAMKESGELPYGQVPALKVEGKILGQSSAIMRFIGKQTGLYPTDAVKAALVDSIMDQVQPSTHDSQPSILNPGPPTPNTHPSTPNPQHSPQTRRQT